MMAPSLLRRPGEVLPVQTVGCDLLLDLDAHAAGSAGDLELGGVEVVGVQVGHLDLGDLLDLGGGDRTGHGAAGLVGALLEAGGLPDEDRRGRRLEDDGRSEEHTSELQSLMRISYAV